MRDPNDWRGTLVALTAKGLKTIEAAVDAHIVLEEGMVASLSRAERKTLAELLKIEMRKRQRGVRRAERS